MREGVSSSAGTSNFWSAHDDEEQQAMLGDSVRPIFDAGLVQLVEPDHVACLTMLQPVTSPETKRAASMKKATDLPRENGRACPSTAGV